MVAPAAVAPGNGYSHVVTGSGCWTAIAGQIALDADGEIVGALPAIRAARDAYIDTDDPPASTAVQVVALFRPELILEVGAYAVVPDR
jgi:enamine deaminase RidA (YjgF/YER057c/UK114 family)